MKLEKVLFILEKELKIKIERRGSGIFFLCPFHEDKNPSLSLEIRKMFFKCFGCEFKARNIYHFWSKYKNLSINNTFQELSNLGYIKNLDKKKVLIEEDSKYKKALNVFSYIYMNNLLSIEGEEVFNYLNNERRIGKETINEFKVGASINSKQLVEILQKKENENFAKIATELNLITTKSEESFDFFWKKQVIIPIENEEGNVVLMASRKISKGENKYIFLPSTIICEKSFTIYNYQRALNTKENFCYLVEGFFDVLSLHEKNIKNSMSVLGTSISNQQLMMLKKLEKKILIFFDGDRAGKESSILISSLLMKEEIDCEIIETEVGKDPDEICKEQEKINQILLNKKNPFIFSIDYYSNLFQIKENPHRLRQLIKKMCYNFYWTDKNIKNFLAKKISGILSLNYEEVWKTLSKEMEEAEGFEPSRA